MAKSKASQLTGPGPLSNKELLKVGKLAKAQPTFIDPFPQTVKFGCVYKTGWIPSLPNNPLVAATKYLVVRAKLDPARTLPRVIADMLTGLRDLVPVRGGTIENSFRIDCRFRLAGREDNPWETKDGSLMLSIDCDTLWFHCNPNHGFSHGRSPKKTFAAERRHNEEVLNRVIKAAQLPLRLVTAGKSFAVEHTANGELRNFFEPAEDGTSFFVCTVPGASPLSLAKRLQRALTVLKPLTPPAYSCCLTSQALNQPVDSSHAIYRHLQEQTWPVRSSEFGTVFRLESLEALDELRALLPNPRKRIRVELGRFKPVVQTARSPVTKLIVHTRQEGHFLTLLLPPEHRGLQKSLEKALSVSFH